MENRKNYYRILHVQPDAPLEIIKSSYRTLMLRLKQHPDLGGEHWNAALINEAYRTLRNPTSRSQYDQQLLHSHHIDEYQQNLTKALPHIKSYCRFCKTPADNSTMQQTTRCQECHSPISQYLHSQIDTEEQRRIERYEKNLPITFYTYWPGTPYQGTIIDLSLQGMCFNTTKELDINQIIKVDCEAFKAVLKISHKTYNLEHFGKFVVGGVFLNITFLHQRGTFVSKKA